MTSSPSVLCPIDYSEASAGALRYAVAIAEHFGARLIVLNVEDPLLTSALDFSAGVTWSRDRSEREVTDFVRGTVGGQGETLAATDYEVEVGKPPVEILRVAAARSCDLIVMSSHGLTGARKLFFGSTTERVLRETTIPVLVTPPVDSGRIHLDDAKRLIGRIVVPVDLSAASLHQIQVAAAVAKAVDVPLVLVHVIEPVRSRLAARLNLAGLQANRRAVADDGLRELLRAIPSGVNAEPLVAHGDPAEEAVKVIRDRNAGLVVMGLHGSPLLGPRMGSVTYRMLCLTQAVVLALPPRQAETGRPDVLAGVGEESPR